MTTDQRALHPAQAGPGGYRQLFWGDGEARTRRVDLLEESAVIPDGSGELLATIAHLSDLHICDAQSPARVEFLDRWADPDSPLAAQLDEVGTYRAQELLTVQVLEACVRAVNAVSAGPVGGAPIDFALSTGDNTDNAQANEMQWYLGLLDGGEIHPDSGDLGRYEGVSDDDEPDERFWHPSPGSTDLPRRRFGFPSAPGLLDAVRAPFSAAGLAMPWLAVHGNHDQLLQGTLPGEGGLGRAAVGDRKPIALPPGLTDEQVLELMGGLAACEPAAVAALLTARSRPVTPDPARRIISRDEFVAAHHHPTARPSGHGFDQLPYYRFDHGRLTLLVLDSVDEFGGWEGSLDRPQFEWLAGELAQADAEQRYVVLASHHPIEHFVNETGPGRVLAAEVSGLLAAHPSVVLWLAGHTHHTAVEPRGTYWQVVAPSLIDWPQQARIVEIFRGDGVLRIVATMLDHAGEAPWGGSVDSIEALAGLSRELAANDWQWRQYELSQHPRAGRPDARNVELLLPDPFPL